MADSAQKVLHELTAAGILSSDEVTKFDKEIKVGVEALIERLVADERITQYQADKFLAGEGGDIAFGDYIVMEELGRGGMGTVLLAKHRRMEREVAIKVLPVTALDSESAVARFYQEVKVAAKLGHPNIVHAYDAGEHHGFHYLVMEYVKGHDLAHVIANVGPMPPSLAIDYIMQACQGLEYAHRKGIVHRDIKPSNLLLDEEGTVKVLDMGLARVGTGVGNETSMNLTTTGQVMGTVEYMSPEQAEDTRAADQRSDIYSLGCTLYRLVTAQSPFARDTVVKTILAHREAPIPLIASGNDPMIVELNPVFQKMVAKNPAERYQNVTALLQDLRQLEQRISSGMSEMTINTQGSTIGDQPTMMPGTTSTNSPPVNMSPGYASPFSQSPYPVPNSPHVNPVSQPIVFPEDHPNTQHQPVSSGSVSQHPTQMYTPENSSGVVFTDSQGNMQNSGPVSMPPGVSNPQLIGIKHHRGRTILMMGVGSLVFLSCLFGFPLGVATWVFANSDLDEMNRGLRDASGMNMTKVGKILGQIAVAFGILGLIASAFGIMNN